MNGLVGEGINEFLIDENRWGEMKGHAGRAALDRQKVLLKRSKTKLSSEQAEYLKAYSIDSDLLVNDLLRYGKRTDDLRGTEFLNRVATDLALLRVMC